VLTIWKRAVEQNKLGTRMWLSKINIEVTNRENDGTELIFVVLGERTPYC